MEAHTGEYLKNHFELMLDALEFPKNQVQVVLRDAESVMKKTIRLVGVKSFDFFLHMLQLVGWLIK